ncbi:MAG: hypothetical protein ABSF50_08945, partial [Burkholderiaceae bacterium]
ESFGLVAGIAARLGEFHDTPACLGRKASDRFYLARNQAKSATGNASVRYRTTRQEGIKPVSIST